MLGLVDTDGPLRSPCTHFDSQLASPAKASLTVVAQSTTLICFEATSIPVEGKPSADPLVDSSPQVNSDLPIGGSVVRTLLP